MFKRVICFCMSIALCVVSVACSNVKHCDLSDYTSATVLSDKEYTNIKEHILNTELTTPYLDFLSQINVTNAKNEVVYTAKIEIRGIPVLLDVLKNMETKYFTEDNNYEEAVSLLIRLGIFETAVFSILRSTDYHCSKSLLEDAHALHKATGHGLQGSKVHLSCFFLTAEAEIPEILESDTDISAKFPKLARFGILAIPYILPEIESGKTEYEDYFTYIGLQHSVEDFIEVTKGIYDEERWETLQNDENYTKGAEDFDYKKWLDENANDIRALLKYIDEYTEEFKDLA